MSRIACLGAAAQNIYLIDHDDFVVNNFVVGKKMNIDKLTYHVGGSGLNAATTFARHGHETILLGNVAQDVAGESIMNKLDEENIDSSYINIINRCSTDCSIILLDSNRGGRTIFEYQNASTKTAKLTPNDLDLIKPDWLYATSLGGDMEKLLEFFEKARSIGCKIMFNPGAAELAEPKKLIGLLDDVDVLLVNKTEAAQIVPGVLLSELLPRLNGYVETVIITDGVMGGIASNRSEFYRFGLYEDAKNQDATGAGDAFGAGFLAHLAAGKTFYDSLVFASANATNVIAQISAQSGALTGKEKLHPMPVQEIK